MGALDPRDVDGRVAGRLWRATAAVEACLATSMGWERPDKALAG